MSLTSIITVIKIDYNINKNSRRNVDSEKSEPQMGFEPTPLLDLVGCYWRICGEQGSNFGSPWNRIAQLHSQRTWLIWPH